MEQQLHGFLQLLAPALLTTNDSPPMVGSRWIRRAWLLGLYVFGLALWGFFLNWGELPFQIHDWSQEWRFFRILQEAVRSARLPLHTNSAAYVTTRFLAIPQTTLSPQVLLLRFLDPGVFVLVNTWILYSVGYAGCLLIQRRYGLSPIVFSILFLLFSFNGHVTAQIAVGHSMWVGFFLLPYFFLLLLSLEERRASNRWHLWMGLTLFFIALQGSIHILAWCFFYLAILWVVRAPSRWAIVRASLLAVLLSAFRVFPAALDFLEASPKFFPGFPSFSHVLESMVSLKLPSEPLLGALSRWEYDMFIGVVGFGFVAYFGLYLYLRETPSPDEAASPFRALFAPAAVLTLLSLGSIYLLVRRIPIPLISHERVPSRFLIMAILTLVILGSLKAQDWLSKRQITSRDGLIGVGLVLLLVYDLFQHARVWRVDQIQGLFSPKALDEGLALVNTADPMYVGVLGVSALISILTLTYTALSLYRRR